LNISKGNGMTLVPCPECQKMISERAVFCPSCGFPLSLPNLYSMTQQNENNSEDSVPKHFLRSNPMKISPQQLTASKQFNISSEENETWGNKPRLRETLHLWGKIEIDNEFFSTVKGTVYDRATGLMWQHSGSKQGLTWDEACKYIIWLNKSRFCNFNDWRLPTIEELASLSGNDDWVWDYGGYFNKEDGPDATYRPFSIDFDQRQAYCWSCDMAAAGEWTCPDRAPDRLSDYIRVDITPNRVWVFVFGDAIFRGRIGPIFWKGNLRPADRCEKFYVKSVRTKLTHSG
jgi:hypothetical protein